MKVTKHTRGPLTFEPTNRAHSAFRIRSTLGQETGGNGIITAERVLLDHDARLYAASPDLLRVLQSAVQSMAHALADLRVTAPEAVSLTAMEQEIADARAVIAKATGEAGR